MARFHKTNGSAWGMFNNSAVDIPPNLNCTPNHPRMYVGASGSISRISHIAATTFQVQDVTRPLRSSKYVPFPTYLVLSEVHSLLRLRNACRLFTVPVGLLEAHTWTRMFVLFFFLLLCMTKNAVFHECSFTEHTATRRITSNCTANQASRRQLRQRFEIRWRVFPVIWLVRHFSSLCCRSTAILNLPTTRRLNLANSFTKEISRLASLVRNRRLFTAFLPTVIYFLKEMSSTWLNSEFYSDASFDGLI